MNELTQEEKDFLIKILTSIPLQGTFQTLPNTLSLIASIIQKAVGSPVEVHSREQIE